MKTHSLGQKDSTVRGMRLKGANMASQDGPQKTSSQEQGGEVIQEAVERTYEHDREREESQEEQKATSSSQGGQAREEGSQDEGSS
jgi:hypothetical protein